MYCCTVAIIFKTGERRQGGGGGAMSQSSYKHVSIGNFIACYIRV